MAKRVLTPEEYKSKMDKKVDKRKRFGKAFLTTFAYALACVVVFSSMVIAFTPNTGSPSGGSVSVNSPNGDSGTEAPVPTVDASATVATDPVDTKKELSNSSTAEEVVAYFNSAINLVKPNAKQITLVKEENKQAGNLDGNLPSSIKSMADGLIADNMGVKDLSKLDPGMVNATTTEQKNAMFPVENETWASKLEASDIEKFDVKDDGKNYTITLNIKADETSEGTDHGVGHSGRVFSVIKPSIVTENAGAAKSILKTVKTGHKDGYVTVTIDKATGNVTAATYYFTWTLEVVVNAVFTELNVSIPFGLQKDFTIAW